jgi:hypothetical protein
MKRQLLFLAVLSFAVTYFSCKKEPNDSYYDSVSCNDPDDSLNTYSLKIGAIFNSTCVRSGCHNSETHKGKVNLEGYDNCVKTFNNKHVLCAIHQDKGCKPMPKNGSKLSDDAIHDITCWAKNGYPQ